MSKDKPSITVEEIPEGHRVYLDKVFLQAVLKTKHHTGQHRQVREGRDTVTVMVWDDLPRDQWTLHFTAPEVPVPVLEAIIATLPKAK